MNSDSQNSPTSLSPRAFSTTVISTPSTSASSSDSSSLSASSASSSTPSPALHLRALSPPTSSSSSSSSSSPLPDNRTPTPAPPADNSATTANVIDFQGLPGCEANRLTSLVSQVAEANSKNAYSLVGIMGCQSTGKSTLLNLLFNCQFAVMDSSQGRQQTTKGIWLDIAAKQHNLVVLDVEGTDSGERGEDRTNFERQTTLYALALCEVLIINMWEHDIGRYTASNYGILKTVFEVNLHLFSPNSKTILLFVIRDHIEMDTSLSQLQTRILKDVGQIWSELRKPAKFADTPVEELFQFEFCGLPHAKLQKQHFVEGVNELRQRFVNSAQPDYFFNVNNCVHFGGKSVPADGFGSYAYQIWNTIKQNKDLDLPTQKEMLATFRCEEIMTHLLKLFEDDFDPLKKECSVSYVPEFGVRALRLVESAMESFTSSTQNYHPAIVSKKQHDLHLKLSEPLYAAFKQQMTRVNDDSVVQFHQQLKQLLSRAEPVPNDFYQLVEEATTDACQRTTKLMQAIRLPLFDEEWNSDAILQELQSKIDAVVKNERQQQLHQLDSIMEAILKKAMGKQLVSVLNEGDKTMWDDVRDLFDGAFSECEQILLGKLDCYRAAAAEKRMERAKLRRFVLLFVRQQVEYNVENILLLCRQKFDRLFKYDKTGLPRRWGANSDPRAFFFDARDAAVKMIDLYSYFPPLYTSDDDQEIDATTPTGNAIHTPNGTTPSPEQNILMSEERARSVREQFIRDVEGALISAEMEKERNSQATKIPAWVFALLVVLGWNEMSVVLYNPIYLLFAVVLVGLIVVLHKTGMLEPALALSQTLFKQYLVGLVNGSQNVPAVNNNGSPTLTRMSSNSETPSFMRMSSRDSPQQRPDLTRLPSKEMQPLATSRQNSDATLINRRQRKGDY